MWLFRKPKQPSYVELEIGESVVLLFNNQFRDYVLSRFSINPEGVVELTLATEQYVRDKYWIEDK